MPVGLNPPATLSIVKGVCLATTAAGIKYPEREDMLLITLPEGSTVAGVFTQNKFCAAPVTLARKNLQSGTVRALLINSGNANAGTGSQGMDNALSSCAQVAQKLSFSHEQVLPFSTGVIGEQLPMLAISAGINKLVHKGIEDNWLAGATAIMTTDTVAKAVSQTLDLDGQLITITGIAKGSGMICPNMATLLSYVATDAAVDNATLQAMLDRATEASFNRITVDSDTSTNDALILMATGEGSNRKINSLADPHAEELYLAIEKVFITLATSVIRDAEGASKFVKIEIVNSRSVADAKNIAYSVAHSPLVKTALFASDPNWGRLLMAVGKADVETLDISAMNLSINGVALIENGEPAVTYTEAAGKQVFQQSEIEIEIDLNAGDQSFHVWTSDLSHDYVSINADYRS
ncbi:MAG: glutamate N-acetyltransferase/amino-acid N-acetyltransferase [Arenicella sp.]|jgi:glutamate N-acetyltransferase/amino-acid N-acetyltransferase